MHSKIILASLVCALATSFGNFKSESTIRNTRPIAEEARYCNSPNEHHASAYVSNERGNISAGGWFEIITDIKSKSQPWMTITECDDPYSLLEGFFSYCDDLGITINIPENDGDYYVGFGIDGREVVKVYIFVRRGLASISTISKNDARAKFFMDYEATSGEKSILRGYTSDSKTRFNAEKRYGNFVYGKNDAKTIISYTKNNASLIIQHITKPSVEINVHAKWYDKKGIDHPLIGIQTEVLTPLNTLLASFYNGCTDENGDYGIKINYDDASKITIDQLKLRFSAINDASEIFDDYGINYTYCYSFEKRSAPLMPSMNLNAYLKINYDISFYCGESDRANAFEIAQAERLPYEYCRDFTNGVPSCKINYPSTYTHYSNNAGEGKAISVRYDDFENWDVLNHEYGHHICDYLDICYVPGRYQTHDIDEDLVIRYGQWDGFYLACSEGLATFIGIASQLYQAEKLNVPGVGDLRYDDPLRKVAVDYGEKMAGLGYYPLHAENIECCVTSVLLKILTNSKKTLITDYLMWKVLQGARFDDCNFSCLFNEILDASFGTGREAIRQILIDEQFPLPYDVAKWTIMIYVGEDVEGAFLDNINQILSVGTTPDDVNIIIQVNKSKNWPNNSIFYNQDAGRYHIENGKLILDEYVRPNGDSNKKIFESFLTWGLKKYPAIKTGIVIDSHGAGVYGAAGFENRDIMLASKDVITSLGITERLEFIAYDACQMQVQDVAEFNSNYFKYMVGSEELVNMDGFRYDGWIEKVYKNYPTQTILKELANSYVQDMLYNHNDKRQTMSVLDLTRMQEYKEAFENLAEALVYNIPLPLTFHYEKDGKDVFYENHNSLGFIIRQSYFFGGSYKISGLIDGLDFLHHLRNSTYVTSSIGTDIIDNAIIRYESVVYYNATGSNVVGLANGMSIYAPYCKMTQYASDYDEEGWVEYGYPSEQTHFKNWRELFFSW